MDALSPRAPAGIRGQALGPGIPVSSCAIALRAKRQREEISPEVLRGW
jgi:hypothetical protein